MEFRDFLLIALAISIFVIILPAVIFDIIILWKLVRYIHSDEYKSKKG